MVVVTRRKGETKDSMFRKFTRSFVDEEIVTEVRKRMYYKKPSLLKKEREKERMQNRHKRFKMTRRSV